MAASKKSERIRSASADNAPKKRASAREFVRTLASMVLMLFFTFFAILGSQFLLVILARVLFGPEVFNSTVAVLIYSALSYLLAILILIFVPPCVRHLWGRLVDWFKDKKQEGRPMVLVSCEELGFRTWPTWTDIGLAVVGFIAYLVIAYVLVSLFSMFTWFDASEEQGLAYSTSVFGLDRIIAFIALVVLAPIAEEVIFRGWLYGKLRRKSSRVMSEVWSIVISVILTSLLFGIIHMQWNVGVNVFAMSLVACGMREVTGTIHAGILLHMIKNGVAFYLLFVVGFL